MNLFPRNSAFTPSFPLELDPLSPQPSAHVEKRSDASEVPYSTLERWYIELNGLVDGGGLRQSNFIEIGDRLEELRDEVHSYLRG